MNDNEFWQFVAGCGASPSADADAFVTAWKAAIRNLSPDELIALNAALARTLRRAYTWDVRGVAYIMNGGCSDDDFLYFRQWLVSRGRAFFDTIVEITDELASLMPSNVHSPFEISELDLVLGDVWEEKTGIDQYDTEKGFPDERVDLDELHGSKWKEDTASMAQRFPKCWARFVELVGVS